MEEIAVLGEDSEDCKATVDKTDESVTPRIDEIKSESDFECLRTKLCSLKRSLKEQRTTCNYLKEERDEAVALNRLLKRQVDELRREVYKGNTRSSPEAREHDKNGNFDTGMSHGAILY